MGDDSLIPNRIADYREREYWDRRYEKDTGNYDWLMSYENLCSLLHPHITSLDKILILGCGNSTLSEELYKDGYHDVVNIDYSKTVIEMMKERLPQMDWLEMDMRELNFEKESFTVVLDKGSLDAVFTDGSSVWDPSTTVRADIEKAINEILRVLKPGGKFISISFGQPHFRKPYIEREGWRLEVEAIPDTFYFFYVCHVVNKVPSD
jgi:SAM-dependent methyltransferase